MKAALSVPGNLLLAGEYCVLEEGGLGLAAAVSPRLRGWAESSDGWSLEGRYPGSYVRWSDGETPADLASRIFSFLLDAVPAARSCPLGVTLDSTAFFFADGRKRGFGSSAAVAVALTALILRASGTPDETIRRDGPLLAVRSHRLAQGGKGSGYDVMTSFHGGFVLFRGGKLPVAESVALSCFDKIWTFPGSASVSSSGATAKWNGWKVDHSEPAITFVQENNRQISALAEAKFQSEVRARLESLARLGLSLGEEIGVTARLQIPDVEVSPEVIFKASGAGNETGLAFFAETLPLPYQRVTIETEGLRWES